VSRPRPIAAGALLVVAIAAVVIALTSSRETVNPFAYTANKQAEFESRAAAGESYLLYALSPGGALATAQRVAALRGPVESAATAAHVDPALVEAVVFLESGGRSDAIAGGDPANAAGVTQILPQTGRQLLGMRIDVSASRRLTEQIAAARQGHQATLLARLEGQRRRIDQRFDPAAALSATGRYLAFAGPKFGRSDFAVVSYHMGIGNLANVVRAYAGPGEKRLAVQVIRDRRLTYAQVYFDSTPFRHALACGLLDRLGDNSDTYYWRVLAARNIMALYHTNAGELRRLEQLQTTYRSDEAVLHPPGSTEVFSDPAAVRRAQSRGVLLPVPNQPDQRHFAVAPAGAAQAQQLGRDPRLYSGLRPDALAVLYYIADRVYAVGRVKNPLLVATTVRDREYQLALARRHLALGGYSLYTTGYSFDIERRYASQAQAQAFQAVLNRLQALDVIAWERRPDVIHITVSDQAKLLSPLLHGSSVSHDA
jgi:transglycosylase-like protein with SLT domain